MLIATKHTAVDYAQLARWSGCIVDARNAMAGIPAPARSGLEGLISKRQNLQG